MPRSPCQEYLLVRLYPGGADHQVRLKAGIGLDLGLCDRTEVANCVSRERGKGVMAPETADDRQFGMIALMGVHGRDLIPGQVLPDNQRGLATGTALREKLAKGLHFGDAFAGEKQPGLIETRSFVREQEEFPRRDVLRQDFSTSVVYPAAGTGQRQSPETVVLGEVTPLRAVHQLQVDQAEVDQAEGLKHQQENHDRAPAKGTDVFSQFHHLNAAFETGRPAIAPEGQA